jgi:hypothetical protein
MDTSYSSLQKMGSGDAFDPDLKKKKTPSAAGVAVSAGWVVSPGLSPITPPADPFNLDLSVGDKPTKKDDPFDLTL